MPDYLNLTLAQTTEEPAQPVTPPTGGGTNQPLSPGGATTQQAPAPPTGGGLGGMLPFVFLLAVVVIMIFMSGRSQRKEKKRREAMLAALKKGDRVQTIGGMLGTVVEVRDHDVVLKVDESSNARIKFLRSAIAGVVDAEAGETK